jgi:aminoglycoside phosphotransferase (APT) family kinase protein
VPWGRDLSVPDFAPALGAYLQAELGLAGPVRVAPVGGPGQSNPTYFVDTNDRRFVLRRQPDGDLLPSAHAVDREFRVMSALHGTRLPVPHTVLYCARSDVVGTPFYLMDRLEGRVFGDACLPGMAPAERRAVYQEMACTLATLHGLEPQALGLADYGRPGHYFQRQIARWARQWGQSRTHDNPALDRLIDWLAGHVPADDARALVHGDFKLNNLMFHPREPRVIAVLDWELSTLGHPLADVAFSCTAWRTTSAEFGGMRGLDLATLGIPTEGEYLAQYRARGGDTSALSPFHFAFSFMRWAVIFEGIAARALRGNAVHANAAEVGALAGAMARRGLEALNDDPVPL